jgi:hypothetical protein
MSPALDLNAYVVGEMVGTGRWDGEREMGIGLHAHREDRHVWSHGGLVGVLYHFQNFRLAIAMDVLGAGSQGVAIAQMFGSQVVRPADIRAHLVEVWANPVPGPVLLDGDQITFVDKWRCDQVDGGESAALCVGFVENLVHGSGVKG